MTGENKNLGGIRNAMSVTRSVTLKPDSKLATPIRAGLNTQVRSKLVAERIDQLRRKVVAEATAYHSCQKSAKIIVNTHDPSMRALRMKLYTMLTPLDDWPSSAIAQVASNGIRQIAPAENVPMDDWTDEMIAAAAARSRRSK